MGSNPRKAKAPESEKFPRKAIHLDLARSDSEEVAARKHAALVTSPEFAAFRMMKACETKAFGEQIDAPSLMEHLREQAVAVNRGDLSQAEAVLTNQAAALQSLFVRLTERGLGQSQMQNFESFIRLALRAQSQCRATLETLAAIKNPPVIYAKQVNQTTGPQQINNGTAAPSRAREIETAQTQLSGGTHELLPDTGASGDASRANPTLETLGEIDRAEVPRG